MAMITGSKILSMPRGGAHPEGGSTVGRRGRRLQPRWGMLYALGLLGGCLLIAGEALFVSAVGRGVWDVATTGATLGALGLWVRANRLALVMERRADITSEAPEDTTEMPVRLRALPMLRKRAA
jgi:hypothetical protein